MTEQQVGAQEALKTRVDKAVETGGAAVPTREMAVEEGRAEDTMRRALDALHKWQAENAPTPEELAAQEAAAAQKKQGVLERRQQTIDKFNQTRAPGEQVPNLNTPATKVPAKG